MAISGVLTNRQEKGAREKDKYDRWPVTVGKGRKKKPIKERKAVSNLNTKVKIDG